MRRIVLLVFVFILSGCNGGPTTPNSPDLVRGTGTVRYLSIEGGFYGIVGDDGRHFDPTNLPDSLRADSVHVRYLARVRRDLASYHMWGEIVDLISIDRDR